MCSEDYGREIGRFASVVNCYLTLYPECAVVNVEGIGSLPQYGDEAMILMITSFYEALVILGWLKCSVVYHRTLVELALDSSIIDILQVSVLHAFGAIILRSIEFKIQSRSGAVVYSNGTGDTVEHVLFVPMVDRDDKLVVTSTKILDREVVGKDIAATRVCSLAHRDIDIGTSSSLVEVHRRV